MDMLFYTIITIFFICWIIGFFATISLMLTILQNKKFI